MKLIFATQNRHKLKEVLAILSPQIEVSALSDFGFFEELPETHFTLDENAAEKAGFIFQRFNQNCFAEDTGLEIKVLNNEPGVFSARYAGLKKSAAENIEKVLHKLKDHVNRKARFRTVICLILDGRNFFFEGVVNGTILNEPCGSSGFGYDPIFRPDGFDLSFAEMGPELKNEISHRRMALEKIKKFITAQ